MLLGRMAAAPSPAVAPPPGNPRFPLLDAMRALAALAIVLTHTASVTNFNTDNWLGAYTARLNLGVALFFLLSRFLLYRPYVAARRAGRPPVRIRDYTRRRVLRIVPAYWVALTVLAIYPGLIAFWDGPWWRSYLFTQIYYKEGIISQGIFPAWTLCIEVSFYVALPFLAAGIGRIVGKRTGAELLVLLALGLASFATRATLQAAGGSYVLQNTIVCYLDWFCVGMAIAVVSVATWGREREFRALRVIVDRPWVPWLLSLAAFWFVSTQLGLSRGFLAVYTDWSYAGEHLLFVLVAALFLLPAVFGDWAGGWPRRIVASPVLAWLGLVSYGIFLYHGPIVLELAQHHADTWLPGSGYLSMTLIAVAISVACAAVSFYLVERPVLRFKDRGSRRSSSRRGTGRRDKAACARRP
jgi:peptidoglycan/LPS O-acetylase OafA/YrhL